MSSHKDIVRKESLGFVLLLFVGKSDNSFESLPSEQCHKHFERAIPFIGVCYREKLTTLVWV